MTASNFWKALKGETGGALIRTFIAKGVSAFGSLGLVVVMGQLYGPSGVGVYALAQGLLLGAGILARRGMDNALIRFVGRDYQSPQVRDYLYLAARRSLVVSLPLGVAVCLMRGHIEAFFAMPGLANVLLGIGLAIPFYTWSLILAGFFKGVRKPATAGLQENGAISLVAAGLLLLSGSYFPAEEQEIGHIGWVYLIAAAVIAAKGQVVIWRWLARSGAAYWQVIEPEAQHDFRAASRSFFIIGIAVFIQSVLSILIAGKLLSAGELGLFKSAQQIAISVAFVLMVINAIFPPRFASLFHEGKMEALGHTVRKAALLGLVLSSPFMLVCLLVPEWILGLLGDGFAPAANLLRILALAQLVNVATGSVGFLLNMTGYDRTMRSIALLCNSLGLLGFILLPQWLGALGAALALAFVLVAQNLVAMIMVWMKLGIWTLPGPNVLAWLGVKARIR